jgi:hypothetical protein
VPRDELAECVRITADVACEQVSITERFVCFDALRVSVERAETVSVEQRQLGDSE